MRSKPAFGHQFLSRGLSIKPCCLRVYNLQSFQQYFSNRSFWPSTKSSWAAPSRVCQWPHPPPTLAHGLSAEGTCAILSEILFWKNLWFLHVGICPNKRPAIAEHKFSLKATGCEITWVGSSPRKPQLPLRSARPTQSVKITPSIFLGNTDTHGLRKEK